MYILQFFLIVFPNYPNPPCQVFPCGRKPENPKKTNDFRKVLMNSSHVRSDARYRGRTRDLGGQTCDVRRRHLDNWATEAPLL